MPNWEKEFLVAHKFPRGETNLEPLPLQDLVSDVHMESVFRTIRGEDTQATKLLTPPLLWSGRVGTGLFGTKDCRSGKHGPGGIDEVVFGVGSGGLMGLIDLGFLPCPACREDWQGDFPIREASLAVWDKYRLSSGSLFDQRAMPFDGRRVSLARLAIAAGSLPRRIYVPGGLDRNAVDGMHEQYERLPRRHEVTVGSYVRGGINPYFTLSYEQPEAQ